jgi:arabinose-5-phosphate isomerase
VGIVEQGDVVLLFSKSGETAELLHLIPFLRTKQPTLVSVSCNDGSSLAKACDLAVTLPLDRELCPFNLSPTTSACLQLIFGDTLSVSLMERTGFTKREYAINHPAGRIGRRLTLRTADLMVKGKELPTCSADATLTAFLGEMAKGCGGVMVVDAERRLVGLFSDGDLRRGLVESGGDAASLSVRALMTPRDKLRQARVNELAYESMQRMESGRPVNFLPVLDEEDRLQGVLRLHDCVRAGL